MGYSVVNVEEIEGEGPGGAVRFVRRKLGVQAFGINWFELGPNVRGREHNEVDTGQEEVNVIIEGGGVYEVDGETIPVRAGSFLRFDPGTTRCPVAARTRRHPRCTPRSSAWPRSGRSCSPPERWTVSAAAPDACSTRWAKRPWASTSGT